MQRVGRGPAAMALRNADNAFTVIDGLNHNIVGRDERNSARREQAAGLRSVRAIGDIHRPARSHCDFRTVPTRRSWPAGKAPQQKAIAQSVKSSLWRYTSLPRKAMC